MISEWDEKENGNWLWLLPCSSIYHQALFPKACANFNDCHLWKRRRYKQKGPGSCIEIFYRIFQKTLTAKNAILETKQNFLTATFIVNQNVTKLYMYIKSTLDSGVLKQMNGKLSSLSPIRQ